MRVNPFLHDPPKLVQVKARLSNVTPEDLSAWASGLRYDCTITVHTGVWFDLEEKVTLVEPGCTLELQLFPGGTAQRAFEQRLQLLLEEQDERYAWVEYDGVGRLV
jgi:hypothetical protein